MLVDILLSCIENTHLWRLLSNGLELIFHGHVGVRPQSDVCRYRLTAWENPVIAEYTKPRKCGLLSLWQVSQVLEVGTFLMPVRTVASAACRLPGP